MLPNLQPPYTGVPLDRFLIAIAVMSVITLLLPRRFGVWIPLLILMGYSLNNPSVGKLLKDTIA